MIIDAHLHVWDLARARYDWLGPELPEVNRDISFDEIEPTLARLGVEGVILVQSADNLDDTHTMLEVAASHPRVVGVVGWADLHDPEAAADKLEALSADPLIVGVRNLIHDRPDPDWVLRPSFREGLALLEQHGLPFDFVTSGPAALHRLVHMAAERPGLRFVLDHLGKPPLNGTPAQQSEWQALLRDAAALPNVVAKISGLYSAVGAESSWTQDGLARVVDTAVEAFGPDRTMYGGDWPMSLRAGGYERVFDGLRRAVAGWPDDAAESFWWRTASQTYGLAARIERATDGRTP